MANQMDDPTRRTRSDGRRPNGRAIRGVTHILRLAVVATLAVALLTNPAMTPGLQAQSSGSGSGSTPPPTVVVAPVVSRQVAEEAQFTGRVQAIQSVDVQARVEGYLQQVAFREGSSVKTGDLLYQIEKAPYEATLAQAEAQLASANAQLASAQANLNNQEINVQRQQTLVQRDTVSQAVVDDAVAKRDAAKADVEGANAAIQNAQAQIQSAQLNLGYTTISAPIDGRLGRTYVTAGNLISQASGTMATLVQLNPIRVAFSVPDTLYTTLVENHTIRADQDASGSPRFTPSLQLPNGKMYERTGTISFAGNQIDASTGTISVYADFDNPDAVLLPGAFVVVKVEQAESTREPVIMASAVMQDRQGDYVFVLNSDNAVETRRVTLGRRTASEVAVVEGLTEGETIVVQGVQKIRPGMTVTPSPLKDDSAAQANTPFVSSDDPSATIDSANQPSGMGTPPAGGSGSGSGSGSSSDASGGPGAAPSGAAGSAPAPASDSNSSSSSSTAPAATPGATGGSAPASSSDAAATATDGSSSTDAPSPEAAAPSGDSASDTAPPAGNDSTSSTPAPAASDGTSATTAPPATDSASDATPAPAASDAASAPSQPDEVTGAASDASAGDTATTGDTTTPPADGTASDPAPAASADSDGEDDLAGSTPANSSAPAAVRGSGAQPDAPLYNATPLQRPGDNAAQSQTPASGN